MKQGQRSGLGSMQRSPRRTKLEHELLDVDAIEQQFRDRRSQVALAFALGMKLGLARAISGDRYLPFAAVYERMRTNGGVKGQFVIIGRDTVKTALAQRRRRQR